MKSSAESESAVPSAGTVTGAAALRADWPSLTIGQVVQEARKLGKPVSVCGEMAGDPAAALALIGLGVNSLSMSISNLARVKWVIRSFSLDEARDLVAKAWVLEDARAIREMYNEVLEGRGLGGLVRAGN